MNNDNISSASEILSRYISGIDMEKASDAFKMSKTWRTILFSLKTTGTAEQRTAFGSRLADHSRLIDLKNGILLIETDHPGWIQNFQMYKHKIIQNLNREFPELGIHSLSFRLAGQSFVLPEIKADQTAKIDEEKPAAIEKSSDLKELMERLRKSILTKN